MAVTVDQIYKLCLRIIRKNQSGSLSSLEFNDFWSIEQTAYMSDLLGRFQRSNNGKEGANTGLIENQTIITKLSPFIKNGTIAVSTGNGPKPADFQYELALRIGGEMVIHINHNQISNVNNSVIDPPSVSNNSYYCVEYQHYYAFLPNTVTSADLDYVSAPVPVLWNYSFDGSGRQVYNPSGSVDPVWDDATCWEITERMLKKVGVSLGAKDFEQYANSVINTGN